MPSCQPLFAAGSGRRSFGLPSFDPSATHRWIVATSSAGSRSWPMNSPWPGSALRGGITPVLVTAAIWVACRRTSS
jgi:hypothetical protein